jgi:hypothetical protein
VPSVPEDPRFSPFALGPFLSGAHRAYLSFLSPLHLHGLIVQVPQVIYAATTGHTARRRTPVGTSGEGADASFDLAHRGFKEPAEANSVERFDRRA